jgi:hypothetical protein
VEYINHNAKHVANHMLARMVVEYINYNAKHVTSHMLDRLGDQMKQDAVNI